MPTDPSRPTLKVLVPRLRIEKVVLLAAAPVFTVSDGTSCCRSRASRTCAASSASPEIAVTATGTFCSVPTRFCAVTITSSKPASSCALATPAARTAATKNPILDMVFMYPPHLVMTGAPAHGQRVAPLTRVYTALQDGKPERPPCGAATTRTNTGRPSRGGAPKQCNQRRFLPREPI